MYIYIYIYIYIHMSLSLSIYIYIYIYIYTHNTSGRRAETAGRSPAYTSMQHWGSSRLSDWPSDRRVDRSVARREIHGLHLPLWRAPVACRPQAGSWPQTIIVIVVKVVIVVIVVIVVVKVVIIMTIVVIVINVPARALER